MTEIQFHRSDMCVIQGDKIAKLTIPAGAVFYNLWSHRGKWLNVDDLLVRLDGKRVQITNPNPTIKSALHDLRAALLKAEIDLEIEVQSKTYWTDTKWRMVKEIADAK